MSRLCLKIQTENSFSPAGGAADAAAVALWVKQSSCDQKVVGSIPHNTLYMNGWIWLNECELLYAVINTVLII